MLDRFNKSYQINEVTGCWEWIAARNAGGYGVISINSKRYYAHRVSYELFCSAIPNNRLVRHRCNNKSCVNPDHLELGTDVDNVQDFVASKGSKKKIGIDSKIEQAEYNNNKVLCNFRLGVDTLRAIRDMMEVTGLNMTDALELLIAAKK